MSSLLSHEAPAPCCPSHAPLPRRAPQIVISSKGFGTGTVQNVTSSVVTYSDVSPTIQRVGGVIVPPTIGGTLLNLTCGFITPTFNYTARITVGGADCPIIDPVSGEVVPSTGVAQMLSKYFNNSLPSYVRGPACYSSALLSMLYVRATVAGASGEAGLGPDLGVGGSGRGLSSVWACLP